MRRAIKVILSCGLFCSDGSLAVAAPESQGPAAEFLLTVVESVEEATAPAAHRRCHGNNQCGPHGYCAKPIGDCDGEGRCRRRPQLCPENYDPVCGCDGHTYSNACFAAMAGVSLAHLGECAQPCHDNGDCPSDTQYCAKPPGHCDGEGRCHERPTACPDIYDPVCGCDGHTYGNACDAAAAGVSIAHEGECPQVCGGIGGIECPKGQFCRLPDGQCCCDIQGECAPLPQVCPDIYDPVCGCDGVTYGNRCEAAMAGQSVEHEGECLPPPCHENSDCASTQYCAKPPGHCDGEGQCHERPTGCPDIYDPVCGCDGHTYSNACEAAAAGQSVDHPGECQRGCLHNEDCLSSADNAYCQKPVGHCDGPGECHPRPQTCPDVWDPVCGCDGMTYGNACEAAAAGVSVAHEGECAQVCGGFAGILCPEGQFCLLPDGQCCCDHQGTCHGIPEVCPAIYDPVCGCDGITYGNRCEAAMHQQSVDHPGPCQQRACATNSDCPDRAFCLKQPGHCDGPGECHLKPLGCPDIWEPVCGCDRQTYPNACDAAAAGVSVHSRGQCP